MGRFLESRSKATHTQPKIPSQPTHFLLPHQLTHQLFHQPTLYPPITQNNPKQLTPNPKYPLTHNTQNKYIFNIKIREREKKEERDREKGRERVSGRGLFIRVLQAEATHTCWVPSPTHPTHSYPLGSAGIADATQRVGCA